MSEDNRCPGVTGQYFSPQLYHPPTSDASSMPLVPAVACTETTQRKRPKYTRSKTGCLTCRVKKVKCDEAKPVCMRCTHGARECSWPEGLPTRKRTGSKRDSIDDRPSTSESITESVGLSESPSSSRREQTPPYGSQVDFVSVLSRVSDSCETYSMSLDYNAPSPYPQQHTYSFPVTSASYHTGTTHYDHSHVDDPHTIPYAMSTTSARQQPFLQASPTYCHSELDTHYYTHRVLLQENMRIGQTFSPEDHPHYTFY